MNLNSASIIAITSSSSSGLSINQSEFTTMNSTTEFTFNNHSEIKDSDSESVVTDLPMPPEFLHITDSSFNCIIAYIFLFLFAAAGNLNVFLSILSNKFLTRRKKCNTWTRVPTSKAISTGSTNSSNSNGKCYSKITLLILHLSIADLIVTFFLIPHEVFWRISVRWNAGNMLCKFCQFGRAFGLYLSSMIIICISLDRYFAIMYPLKLIDGQRRVKWMLTVAWIAAILFSAPQSFIFSVKSHPMFPSFQQCVSIGFFETHEQEMVYNVFSVTAMYFVPFAVIIFTYSSVLWKIIQKARQHQGIGIGKNMKDFPNPISVISSNSMEARQQTSSTPTGFLNVNELITRITNSAGSAQTAHPKVPLTLRTSDNAVTKFSRARTKTLKMTLLIVLVFLISAVPYVVMTLWYMFDRESAMKVDPRIQDGCLVGVVVANSCMNPIIYGSFSKNCSSFWCCNLFSLCRSSETKTCSKDETRTSTQSSQQQERRRDNNHRPALLTLSGSPAITNDFQGTLPGKNSFVKTKVTKLLSVIRKSFSCLSLSGHFHNNLILTQQQHHQMLTNHLSVNISNSSSPVHSVGTFSTVIPDTPTHLNNLSTELSRAIFVT